MTLVKKKDKLPALPQECVVKGCCSKKNEIDFVGSICQKCWEMLTKGYTLLDSTSWFATELEYYHGMTNVYEYFALMGDEVIDKGLLEKSYLRWFEND